MGCLWNELDHQAPRETEQGGVQWHFCRQGGDRRETFCPKRLKLRTLFRPRSGLCADIAWEADSDALLMKSVWLLLRKSLLIPPAQGSKLHQTSVIPENHGAAEISGKGTHTASPASCEPWREISMTRTCPLSRKCYETTFLRPKSPVPFPKGLEMPIFCLPLETRHLRVVEKYKTGSQVTEEKVPRSPS